MPRYKTANDIVNAVAIETGIGKDDNPYSSQNAVFIQLRGLLDAAGQELVELHDWQILEATYQKITSSSDSGTYDLPDDFSRMINQTGWDHTNDLPVGGPLTPQTWAYLRGRDLVNQTIYATFQLADGKFQLLPNPVPEGLDLNFRYISRNWVLENGTSERFDEVQEGSNLILFEPILIQKFLKAKHLEAKGFDSSSARLEFENMYDARTGSDTGATILSASGDARGLPYLDPYRNMGDTGYGIP